jgi:hypothetical protein
MISMDDYDVQCASNRLRNTINSHNQCYIYEVDYSLFPRSNHTECLFILKWDTLLEVRGGFQELGYITISAENAKTVKFHLNGVAREWSKKHEMELVAAAKAKAQELANAKARSQSNQQQWQNQ